MLFCPPPYIIFPGYLLTDLSLSPWIPKDSWSVYTTCLFSSILQTHSKLFITPWKNFILGCSPQVLPPSWSRRLLFTTAKPSPLRAPTWQILLYMK
ncbi:hypothetical protein ATANTOWER_029158 [Ataeniobius toweri]|uniref:Uncharacterized protein n=1 Tax=Ataeniobius toweri TaxID=208326 RepID=A0ABU7BL13_9TELE|nr:hypothetical protein [Ataeniobius toweri]